MAETFVAHVSMTINASRAKVWDALVNPAAIRQYMPVTDVLSGWREGSPIVWKSDFQGKPFEVKGTILRLEAQRLLLYSHSLPMFRASRAIHLPLNNHEVTIDIHDGVAQ